MAMNLKAAILLTISVFAALAASGATKESVLYSFQNNGTDGRNPTTTLIMDSQGNLYGVTPNGGAYCGSKTCGTVFELSPSGTGQWTETVLHSFGNGTDGYWPYGSLILDSAGNLYGTTMEGGEFGGGIVFELSPGGNGQWTETILHNFGRFKDGSYPESGLVLDSAGNLYGTTVSGGAYLGCNGGRCGTAFELTKGQDGSWSEKILHNFGHGKDGFFPYSQLVFDSKGNLYGTTLYGGGTQSCPNGQSCGTAFELMGDGKGNWTEKVLHNFRNDGLDGGEPFSGLIFDLSGNLYGTTLFGGRFSLGTVFELIPGSGEKWSEKTLHSFTQDNKGCPPQAGLLLDSAGNLYGTTSGFGKYNGGTAFRLSPGSDGKWTLAILHYFYRTKMDGLSPYGGLIMDGAGTLYGTTFEGGGTTNSGTVFQITF